jgi:hypothetical protein
MNKKLHDKHEVRKWNYLLAISTQILLVSMEQFVIGEWINYLLVVIAAEMVLYLLYFGFPKRK